nr:MAG TPA: hypothetical protein [Caudoviricetes sp.]
MHNRPLKEGVYWRIWGSFLIYDEFSNRDKIFLF